KEILDADPGIEVIGTAGDPFAAAERMRREVPDVITLDVEMPRMDGISFLDKLMHQHPLPVVVCSSLVGEGSQTAFAALAHGAVDVVEKPRNGSPREWKESSIHICDAVRAAAHARVGPRRARPTTGGAGTRSMAKTTGSIPIRRLAPARPPPAPRPARGR